MSSRRRPTIMTTACLVAGLVAMSGCSNSDAGRSTTSTSVVEQSSTTSSTASTTTSKCSTEILRIQIGAGAGSGMNHMRKSLDFTNIGATECSLYGFPGVSFVAGADNHQVGSAAKRDDSRSVLLVLQPGQTGHADLDIVNTGVFDPEDCQPTAVAGLRVYPPEQTDSILVPYAADGCASTDPKIDVLGIGPMQQGAGTSS